MAAQRADLGRVSARGQRQPQPPQRDPAKKQPTPARIVALPKRTEHEP
jgi:hypothetical protein